MTEQEYERLSALVDDELPPEEIAGEINKLYQSDEGARSWSSFHLIGDAMRGDMGPLHSPSLAAEISRRLEDEPVVLAPAALKVKKHDKRRTVTGLAVAASLVGAAVVFAPQLISPQSADAPQQLVEAQPPAAENKTFYVAQDGTRWELLKKPEVESRLNAYLVNHRERSPASKIKGIMPYATFVSYDGNNK